MKLVKIKILKDIFFNNTLHGTFCVHFFDSNDLLVVANLFRVNLLKNVL